MQWINSLTNSYLWVGILMRRKFVFFSDKLEISSEHAMDTNGLLDLKVH